MDNTGGHDTNDAKQQSTEDWVQLEVDYQGYRAMSHNTKLSLATLLSILPSVASVHTAGYILKKKSSVNLSSMYPCLMDTELVVRWKRDMFVICPVLIWND